MGEAAAQEGGTLGLGGIGSALANTSRNPHQPSIPLIVGMVTGGDDLRQGSQAIAYIQLVEDNQFEELTKLRSYLEWDTGAFNVVAFQFKPQIFKPVPLVKIATR